MGGFFTNTRKPEGLGGRLMVAMMNWGHAPVARWGRSFLRLKAGATILDLGCGGGANLAVLLKLCPDGTAVGLDYSSVSVKKASAVNCRAIAEGRCQIIQGDVQELPFADDSFEQVTAFETIYFWPNLEEAFQQVFRVLKPGGSFLVCNESNGEDPKQEKWCDIIGGMTSTPANGSSSCSGQRDLFKSRSIRERIGTGCVSQPKSHRYGPHIKQAKTRPAGRYKIKTALWCE